MVKNAVKADLTKISTSFASFLVLMEGKSAAGCVGLKHQGDACEVSRLCVSPSLRGKGWGATLLEKAILLAKEIDAVKCVVATTPNVCEEATELYLSRGFKMDEGRVDLQAGLSLATYRFQLEQEGEGDRRS